MKLSMSNIGWDKKDNDKIYQILKQCDFDAIEIAPTNFFEYSPYDNIEKMIMIKNEIKNLYDLDICSMQSILFNKEGNIFNKQDQDKLLKYIKKAIDFAGAINCKNIVFGCPKNRIINENNTEDDVISFFKELGDYANEKQTTISIEPNPVIYGTNFINYTSEAFSLVKRVSSDGFKVNLDFGTIIQNEEDINELVDNANLINHIHISEPNLEKISRRTEHKRLAEILKKVNYKGYISIEMKLTHNIQDIIEVINYVGSIFK